MKRLLILFACCLLLCTAAFAAEPVITNLKTDCVVSRSGECKITQTFNLSMDEAQKELSFPLGEKVKDAAVAGYNARKTTVDGTDVLVLSDRNGFAGNRSFTVTYTLKNLVTASDGRQSMTLPMLCAEWPWEIQAFDFTVTMPQSFMEAPTFESGYSGDVIGDYMNLTVQDNVIRGSLSQTLRDHESLTMLFSTDDGYFTASRETKGGVGVYIILIVLCMILGVVYWFFTLRSAKLSAASRALPPDSSQPGDLPYLLCGKKAHFNAMILCWASLGYLTISQSEDDVITLTKNMDMGNERRKYEYKLFEMLFSEGPEVDGTSLIYKQTAAKAENAIPNFWRKRLYDRSSGNVLLMRLLAYISSAIASLAAFDALLPDFGVRWLALIFLFLVGGVLGFAAEKILAAYYLNDKILGCISGGALLLLIILGRVSNVFGVILMSIALLAFTAWQTVHGGRRSEYGTQMISQALGFHRYFSKLTDNRAKALQAQDPQYFYNMLPYAIAMNCGVSFAQSFGETDLEPCGWFRDSHQIRTVSEFYSRLDNALGMLDIAINK